MTFPASDAEATRALDKAADNYLSAQDFFDVSKEIFAFFGTLNSHGYVLRLHGKVFTKTSVNSELIVGQKFSETAFWHSSEHTPELLRQLIEKTSAGEKTKAILDFRLSSDNKLFVELHLFPAADNSGNIEFFAYDVTTQEKQSDFFKQRSEHLLFAAESAEIGLWSWDLTDNSVYLTPRCRRLFEIASDEEMTYDRLIEMIHPDDRSRVEEILVASQNHGTEYEEEFRIITSEGLIEWVGARGKTFLDETGTAHKMMGVVRQITSQKIAETDLAKIYEREKRARDEAEDANRSKDFFLAFVSHELRSPLNAILGWSKILLTKNVDAETTKNALETIERSARSQAKLINDLVDSARIASGKLRLEFQKINLYEILNTVFHSQKPTAAGKNINLELNAEDEQLFVFGDGSRLQQVFNNIISNALKFTPENGAVSIETDRRGDSVSVFIRDNGQGISAETLPNIFRQFSQGDEKIPQDRTGLGLGLSIVKILIEKHGGTVRAESPGIGQGSIFVVTLPLTAGDAPIETDAPVTAEDKPLGGVKILLVEDDNDSREVLDLFLSQCGAKVTTADSAQSAMNALKNLASELPDVLISDLAMPGEDGYSLITRIRRLSESHGGKIPAIALSAFATKENKERAYQCGFQKYGTKPFDPDLLVQNILKLLNGETDQPE